MKVKNIKTEALVPYGDNPRRIGEDAVNAVKESIERFGFRQPLVVDRNNVVVAGHTRLMAAKALGLATVPCVVADDLTDEQVRAYRLADNKVAELATWDVDLLESELEALGELEVDMGAFGFDDETQDSKEDGTDSDPPVNAETGFSYKSQFGVIVMCKDEAEQEKVYDELKSQGYECKVVTT